MAHRWHIDDREYERHELRRGRRHAYGNIDAERTALVVVDMIPFFVEASHYARSIVSNINTLASALRRSGGWVAWVVPTRSSIDESLSEFYGPEQAAIYQDSGGVGPIQQRIAPSLDVEPGDLFAEKTAPSAFFPGRCDLSNQLSDRDINTVIVVGTVANVCCESTVRDASTLGYRTIMVADANAARRDEDLNATLYTVYRSFGDVRTTQELADLLT